MGADLQQLLADGELACGLQVVPGDHDHLQSLYEDPAAAGVAWYERNEAIQLSHVICIRSDTLAANPELGQVLVDAFSTARSRVLGGTGVDVAPYEDPMPIGFGKNRKSLELLMRHAVDQHVLKARVDLADLFCPDAKQG